MCKLDFKEEFIMERTVDYIGFRRRYCDIVKLGRDWFDYRNDGEELPKVGAFCKTCAKETAKPVYPIYMNGKPAYALQCKKCGGEYPMYKSMFITRYVGYKTKSGGRINPTHGILSDKEAMDRKARDYHNSISQRVEDSMCKAYGYTHGEYRAMKKEWDEANRKEHKRFENEKAEFQTRFRDERIQKESNTRRELIEKGILKYVKNIGLVNTETGEVVKL